jgi:hypothetical protein
LPAVEDASVNLKEWWVQGRLHRDKDQPAVQGPGSQRFEWWVHGEPHRNNGLPAVMWSTDVLWWLHHRLACRSICRRWAMRHQTLRLGVCLALPLDVEESSAQLNEDVAIVVLGPCLARNLRIHWSQ